jgi:hypothetical protein
LTSRQLHECRELGCGLLLPCLLVVPAAAAASAGAMRMAWRGLLGGAAPAVCFGATVLARLQQTLPTIPSCLTRAMPPSKPQSRPTLNPHSSHSPNPSKPHPPQPHNHTQSLSFPGPHSTTRHYAKPVMRQPRPAIETLANCCRSKQQVEGQHQHPTAAAAAAADTPSRHRSGHSSRHSSRHRPILSTHAAAGSLPCLPAAASVRCWKWLCDKARGRLACSHRADRGW